MTLLNKLMKLAKKAALAHPVFWLIAWKGVQKVPFLLPQSLKSTEYCRLSPTRYTPTHWNASREICLDLTMRCAEPAIL